MTFCLITRVVLIADLYLRGIKVAGFNPYLKSVHFFPTAFSYSKMNAISWIHLEIAVFILNIV